MASIVTLNGTAIYPSNIEVTLSKIGKTQISANGGRIFLHRTISGTPIYKNKWDLTFDGISEAQRATVRALAVTATTMPFVDELGVSRTVQTEEECYSAGVAAIAPPNGLTLYYNVKLTLWEA